MADALRAELAELADARSQVDARLRQLTGAGRGRGSQQGGRWDGAPPLWPGRGAGPARDAQRIERNLSEARVLSSVVVPAGDKASVVPESAAPTGEAELAAQQAPDAHASGAALKRPLRTEDDNPALRKRNQRMFGALMGTLQKFRQEEGANNRQEATAKRASMLQRAEERELEESKRLREMQRDELGEKRRTDLLLRHRLAAAMEEKRLRLAHLTWSEHHARVAAFLITAASPPVYFLPSSHCAATREALEAQHAASDAQVQEAEARLEEALRRAKEHAAQREAELTGAGEAGAKRATNRSDADAGPDADVPAEGQRRREAPAALAAHADDDADLDEAAENPPGLAGVLGTEDAS